MGEVFEKLGVNHIMGRICGLLITAKEPLSLQQIAEQLSLSKASISIQIRNLEKYGYCRRLPKAKDRKNYYELHEDFLIRTYMDRIKTQEKYIIMLESMLKDLANNKDYEHIVKRIEMLKKFQQIIINTTYNALEEWNKQKDR